VEGILEEDSEIAEEGFNSLMYSWSMSPLETS
jgi:hypothetical protein